MARLLYLLTGGAITLFWIVFAVTSVRERKKRAAVISGGVAFGFGAVWFGWFFLLQPPGGQLLIPVALAGLLTLLFFTPPGRPVTETTRNITSRVDERDVIFAREEYASGSDKYQRYYDRRPEFKAMDDRIRRLPKLLTPGGKFYDPHQSRAVESLFEIIEELTPEVAGPTGQDTKERPENPAGGESVAGVNTLPATSDAPAFTAAVKRLATRLGALEVGITPLDPAFVYSHVGRGPEPWGNRIENRHRYAIVFSLEMRYRNVEAAPRLPITEESARKYLKGSLISVTLAEYIRQLGYPARAHVAGSNYQIMLPPVAQDAGLGEVGRFGYLISRRFGARVRLGAVTTDLPLVPDAPFAFGVQEFCAICKRCAVNCPSGSIPREAKETVRGVAKWPLSVETCLYYWRFIGTDCGLCMKVCPYSHPRAFVHDIVRTGIERSRIARYLATWGENLFYGRRVKFPAAERRSLAE
ncbi:MAG: reductive dehalogenase domain-containing protein [bacterium]